jgi:hypothetical protein
MRLGVVDVLQAVFEAAQELVGHRQLALGLRPAAATLGEQGEDLQVGRICSAGSRPPRISWKTWAMNSISRMPPGPSLMCSAMSLRATSRRIWACRSRMALIAPKSRYLRKTNGRQMLCRAIDPFRLQIDAFVHHPRLDPGVAFPLAALRDEVVFERAERADQRPGVAVRSQAHVDPENLAVFAEIAEGADQALAEAQEEIVVVEPATTRRLPFLGIDENVIDVGRDVEFAAAELAHADDQQPLRLAAAVERFAEQLAQLPMDKVEREVGGHIGELGHAFDNFAQRRQVADVAHDQGRHHALAQLPQGALQALVAARRGLREKVAHLRRGDRLRGVLVEPGGDLRAGGEQLAQVAAVRLGGLPG